MGGTTQMKKKIVSVLLVVAMAVSMFTGCGSKSDSKKSDSKSGEKTLEVWVPPLDEDTVNNWGDLLTDWEKENNCKVNITLAPWENYEETYTTALNSGEGPDVGYMYNEMFPTYIDAGAITDMSEYVTDDDEKEYKYLKNGYVMDGQYGWPLVTGVPFVMYYNEDILNELVQAALNAPTGMGRQTWKFTVITNQDAIKKICKVIEKKLDRPGYNMYCPMALIMPSNEKDSPFGKEDNACALENIFLAAHSYGIGSVWINQLQNICDDKDVRSVLDELGVPANHVVYGMAALGYAADDAPVKEKKITGQTAFIE